MDMARKEQLFTQLRTSPFLPRGEAAGTKSGSPLLRGEAPGTKPQVRRQRDQAQSRSSLSRDTQEPIPIIII